jgi:hypothetical protein
MDTHFVLLSTGTLEVSDAILLNFPEGLVVAQDGFGLGTRWAATTM